MSFMYMVTKLLMKLTLVKYWHYVSTLLSLIKELGMVYMFYFVLVLTLS